MKKYILLILCFFMVSGCISSPGAKNGFSRKIVVQSIVPNKVGIDGSEFKTKPNTKGEGVFVFHPQTKFMGGIQRYIIWIVIKKQAYPLTMQAKTLTPELKWPREADPGIWKKTGLDLNAEQKAVDIVFGSK